MRSWNAPRRGTRLTLLTALMLVVGACGGSDDTAAPAPAPAPAADGAEADVDPFPTEEITFITPLPAGSAPDVTFRQLTELAQAELGVRIVVINRAGGGGSVGVGELATSEPDGYTIGMGASAMLILQPELQDISYSGPEDFTPIINATSATFVLFSPVDRKYGDLEGFIAEARARPGELSVGIPGLFSIPHLQMELLRREADIDFVLVPVDAGEQVTAVINGTLDAAVAQPPIVLQHEQNGTVEILGLISPLRSDRFDMPLFTDFGYDVEVVPFEFVAGPAGIPENRVKILHDAFRVAFESEAFQAYVAGTALLPDYLDSQSLSDRLSEQTNSLRSSIADFGWEPS